MEVILKYLHGYIAWKQIAPYKKKYPRDNHLPIMNKTISKEIMKRNRLRNKFLKNRTDENKSRYTKQRNYCDSLLRKTKTVL